MALAVVAGMAILGGASPAGAVMVTLLCARPRPDVLTLLP